MNGEQEYKYYLEAVNNTLKRLVELDSVPVEERARMTYSLGSINYDWNGYRQALLDMLKSYEEVLKCIQSLYPFTKIYVAR